MSDEFTIDGVGFKMKPIPVLESETVYNHLVPILTPVFTLAANNMAITPDTLAAAMRSMPEAIGQLRALNDFFVKHCSVSLPGEYQGAWMDLDKKAFFDKAFPPRSHSRHFEWVVRCVIAEYSTFLFELWERVKDHVQMAESQSQSQSGLPGTSGE